MLKGLTKHHRAGKGQWLACMAYNRWMHVIKRELEPHQRLQLFPSTRNLTICAQTWLVTGTDSSVFNSNNVPQERVTSIQTHVLFTIFEICCTFYRCIPLITGVGVGICFVALYVGMYYNTIIAWALYYLIASFRYDLSIVSLSDVVILLLSSLLMLAMVIIIMLVADGVDALVMILPLLLLLL